MRQWVRTSSLPTRTARPHLQVVGYDFKARRFSDLHRAALRLPQEAFRYEGTPALNEAALRVSGQQWVGGQVARV